MQRWTVVTTVFQSTPWDFLRSGESSQNNLCCRWWQTSNLMKDSSWTDWQFSHEVWLNVVEPSLLAKIEPLMAAPFINKHCLLPANFVTMLNDLYRISYICLYICFSLIWNLYVNCINNVLQQQTQSLLISTREYEIWWDKIRQDKLRR